MAVVSKVDELYRAEAGVPDDEADDATEAGLAANLSASLAASFSATVSAEHSGLRLDAWLAAVYPKFSRSHWQKLIAADLVRLDGKNLPAKTAVFEGQVLEAVLEAPPSESSFQPEPMNLQVVFDDAHIAVINKPAGLVVHPAAGNWSGTLLNGILAQWPGAAGLPRAGIVHRLDKETSGLLVIAKTAAAQWDLVKQLQAKTVARSYLAVVRGRVLSSGRVDAPIARDPRNRLRMGVLENGKEAGTRYAPQSFGAIDDKAVTLVRCELETGRTHQIRVHMAHIGFPLVGDHTYGGMKVMLGGFTRQALHAAELALAHPASGETLQWQCAPPADFLALAAAAKLALP
jgi:23S rRNA pseudouridine1911/1915/1917 synthase